MRYINPYLLLNIDPSTESGDARSATALRRAKKRLLARVDLRGAVTLHGVTFDRSEVLTALNELEDEDRNRAHREMAQAPRLAAFLMFGRIPFSAPPGAGFPRRCSSVVARLFMGFEAGFGIPPSAIPAPVQRMIAERWGEETRNAAVAGNAPRLRVLLTMRSVVPAEELHTADTPLDRLLSGSCVQLDNAVDAEGPAAFLREADAATQRLPPASCFRALLFSVFRESARQLLRGLHDVEERLNAMSAEQLTEDDRKLHGALVRRFNTALSRMSPLADQEGPRFRTAETESERSQFAGMGYAMALVLVVVVLIFAGMPRHCGRSAGGPDLQAETSDPWHVNDSLMTRYGLMPQDSSEIAALHAAYQQSAEQIMRNAEKGLDGQHRRELLYLSPEFIRLLMRSDSVKRASGAARRDSVAARGGLPSDITPAVDSAHQ